MCCLVALEYDVMPSMDVSAAPQSSVNCTVGSNSEICFILAKFCLIFFPRPCFFLFSLIGIL